MPRHSTAIDAHVASRVRLRRMTAQISQETVAAALGVTFQQVQKYESGRNRITAGCLFEIAHVLGVPVTCFYEGIPAELLADPPKASGGGDIRPSLRFLNTRHGLALNQAFVRIPSIDVRRSVLNLLEAIAR